MDGEKEREWARAYAKGYAAGKRKKATDGLTDKRRREEVAFWDRAFLAVSPYFAGSEPWARGEKKLSSLEDRVELAAKFANQAIKHRRQVR